MYPSRKTQSSIDEANEKLWARRFESSRITEKSALTNLSRAEKAGYHKGVAYARLNLTSLYFLSSRNDLALKYINEALQWFRENEEGKGLVRAILLQGNIYESFGDYEKTLSLWLEALKISKMIADPESEAEACSQLGLVYLRLSSQKKALEYLSISLKLREEISDENAIASTLNRIGMVLRQTKKYHESLGYYFRSLAIREKNQQLSAIPWTYLGIASTYEASGDINEALKYFLQGSEATDPRCKLQCMMGAGRMLSLKDNKEEAHKMLRASLQTARQLKALTLVAEAYSALSGYYESIGAHAKALKHYRLFQETRESVLSEEAQSRLRNVEISHAVEKSEQEKEIFRLRNVELRKAYDLIEEKNRDITSSINYASRIQTAILPKLSDLKSYRNKLFILYMPKDIVSGDFYWFTILDEKLVLVAGDCTGHGVPGALMSMLGISFLEEIVNNRRTDDPASILEELGKEVKRSLHQDGDDSETKDGMDMSVCIIDNKTKRVNFSGANNNLYLLRDGQVNEFKADRMPVGLSYSSAAEAKFTNHEIISTPGDMIYMFSDGYADQFGGPGNKKYKYSTLKNTLLKIHKLPLTEQKKSLEKEFYSWKGENIQIDDVLIIGYRI